MPDNDGGLGWCTSVGVPRRLRGRKGDPRPDAGSLLVDGDGWSLGPRLVGVGGRAVVSDELSVNRARLSLSALGRLLGSVLVLSMLIRRSPNRPFPLEELLGCLSSYLGPDVADTGVGGKLSVDGVVTSSTKLGEPMADELDAMGCFGYRRRRWFLHRRLPTLL